MSEMVMRFEGSFSSILRSKSVNCGSHVDGISSLIINC